MKINWLVIILAVLGISVLTVLVKFGINSYNNEYTFVDPTDVKTLVGKINKDTFEYYQNIIKELVQYENMLAISQKKELVIKDEYNVYDYTPTNVDSDILPFSLEMFEAAGVDFPKVHYIIFFKETSFCRGFYNNNRNVSLCSHELIDVLGFNPYNGSGMKYPKHRVKVGMCTAVGSIGDITTKNCKYKSGKGSYCLPKGYERFYTDPHAVYNSPMDHCIDIGLWQKYWYKKKGYRPKTVDQYIKFLEDVGYNPYDHYYHNKTSGLKTLYEMYNNNQFHKKYDKYYKERIKDSINQFYY